VPYDRITHEPPSAAGYYARELVHFVRRTSIGPVEIHHIRQLADLTRPGKPQPAWAQAMAKRRRKTLAACAACHATIHARQPAATPTE
jgi:cytochrome c553